jgi:hypothetical protein
MAMAERTLTLWAVIGRAPRIGEWLRSVHERKPMARTSRDLCRANNPSAEYVLRPVSAVVRLDGPKKGGKRG